MIVDSQEKLIGEVRKFLQDEQLGKALADKASNVIKNSENIAEKIVGEMVGEMAGEMGL